ncbi:MAG: transketolase [Chitinispirillales bacterium]|jgi:transketolase|nr:transketolase [Chitinispirillales bacterium]
MKSQNIYKSDSDGFFVKELRKEIFRMMHYSNSSHIGGCLSCIDILYALYFKVMDCDKIKAKSPDRDIFILSKGHNSAALYVTLAYAGFFPKEYLSKYYIDDGVLPGHLDMASVNGIECSSGSLGHGAGIGLGMAIAKDRDKNGGHVYVLMGDGECNEGSVWEAVMLAATLKQRNYTLIIDFNHLQGMGRDVIRQNNMAERFAAFGFKVTEVNGHDIGQLAPALRDSGGPRAVIAHTVKGCGVSFTEDKLEWHYKSPNDEQFEQAVRELG